MANVIHKTTSVDTPTYIPNRTGKLSYYSPGGPYWYNKTVYTSLYQSKHIVRYKDWYADKDWRVTKALYGYLPTRGLAINQFDATQVALNVELWRHHSAPGSDYWENAQFTNVNYPVNWTTGPPPNALPWHAPDFLQPAKSKCLNKIRDMKSNVPVFLAEGRQAVDMIYGRAQQLARAYKAFKRGRFDQAAKILGVPKPKGNLANNWLEWAYGWLPLISDLKGLAEFAAQHLESNGRPLRLRVSAKVQGTGSKYTRELYVGVSEPYNGWKLYYQETVDPPTFSGKAWLYVELARPQGAIQAQLGMNLIDLGLVAWELVPFSFVFDWFFDVGQWLTDIGSLDGWRVLDGGNGYMQLFQIRTSPNRWTWYDSTQDSIFPMGFMGPSSTYSKRTYDRFSWDGGGNVIKARFTDALNARRLASAASLGDQLRTRR